MMPCRDALRDGIGLPSNQPVLLTPFPPSREAGQYYAVWATALLQQLYPAIRVIVPGDSKERARLERFVRSFRMPDILVCTGSRWSFRELASVADVLVVPAVADPPGRTVVQMRTAGLPVVASDVPVLRAEIADGVTGLLVPPAKPARLAGAVLKVLQDDELRTRLTEAARRRRETADIPLMSNLGQAGDDRPTGVQASPTARGGNR